MTTEEVLEVVRQKIGQAIDEVGGNAPTYPDDFLLRCIKTVNFTLLVLGVVTNVTVDTTNNVITPDPSLPIGMLLASGGTVSVIKDDLLNRLKNGELGMSFSSGATTISTIQAATQLRGFADSLDNWYNTLLAAYMSGDPNMILGRDI